MIEDLRKWQALIEKHDNLVWKLERSKVSNNQDQDCLLIDVVVNTCRSIVGQKSPKRGSIESDESRLMVDKHVSNSQPISLSRCQFTLEAVAYQ